MDEATNVLIRQGRQQRVADAGCRQGSLHAGLDMVGHRFRLLEHVNVLGEIAIPRTDQDELAGPLLDGPHHPKKRSVFEQRRRDPAAKQGDAVRRQVSSRLCVVLKVSHRHHAAQKRGGDGLRVAQCLGNSNDIGRGTDFVEVFKNFQGPYR